MFNRLQTQEMMESYRRKMQYRITPLTDLRNKPRIGLDVYCERNQVLGHGLKTTNKHICVECRKIYLNSRRDEDGLRLPCEQCGSTNIIRIGPIARLPRKNASKKKWDEFWKYCGKNCAGGCR